MKKLMNSNITNSEEDTPDWCDSKPDSSNTAGEESSDQFSII